MGLTLNHFLVLGAVLFCIGLYGALLHGTAIRLHVTFLIFLKRFISSFITSGIK